MTPDLLEFRRYMEVERGFTPATVTSYLAGVRRFFERCPKPFFSVTEEDVRAYLFSGRLSEYTTGSLSNVLSALRAYYFWLEYTEQIPFDSDPTRHVILPSGPPPLPNFLTKREMARLLGAINVHRSTGVRDRAVIEFLYSSGARQTEMRGLRLVDVDLDHGEARVMGKGMKERPVFFGGPAADWMRRYIEVFRSRLPGACFAPTFFLGRKGGALNLVSVCAMVSGAARTAGLPGRVHPHTLRHTFATHLLEGGMKIEQISALLGHENITTTMRYTHVDGARMRALIEKYHPRAKQSAWL